MKPIMFFDGGCPLCRREVAHYKRIDRTHRVRWSDLSRETDLLQEFGIDPELAMKRLHAADEQGRVLTGVPAFVVVWRHLPFYRHIARVVERLGLIPVLDALYVRFAAWRYRRRCDEASCSPPHAR